MKNKIEDIDNKNMFRKRNYIFFTVLLFALAVTFIDAFVHPPYFLKIIIKIIFFLALPMSFFAIYNDEWDEFKKIFSFKKKGLIFSILLGLIILLVTVFAFLIVRNFIDFGNVTESLTSGMGITKENYFYVAIYISILNSFLEEFFFRGFGFITFKKFVNIKFAYLFSPILFAIYHAGMLFGMFKTPFFLLLLFGLFVLGLICNYLNNRFKNIYPSWFVHMGGDFAINIVGFILFGLI